MKSIRIFLALLFLAATALAQPWPPRIVSPEIFTNNTVTFRLRAPDAQKVTIYGDWPIERGGGAMTKDDKGVWSLNVGPLAPDIYSYTFNVDGVNLLDPANKLAKPSRSLTGSVLDLPPPTPAMWDRQPGVARGTVHLHDYFSKSLGRERRLRVYTPPGYDASKRKIYPVFYLLHGSGDNEAVWTEYGHANIIFDNLIAAGKAVPMVVVMTDGHASLNYSGTNRSEVGDFERDLFQDVMPLVEANYRVGKTPATRAIAGLSMGGNQALTIGLDHLDTFGWVGGMSSAMRDLNNNLAPFLANTKANSAKLKLLWFACGKDDRLFTNNVALHDLLVARGVPHEWVVTEGNHRWTVWRRNLVELTPKLFQSPKR
jgi:enterochelin esterase family protein